MSFSLKKMHICIWLLREDNRNIHIWSVTYIESIPTSLAKLCASHGNPQEAGVRLDRVYRGRNGEMLYGSLPGRKLKLSKPFFLPSHFYRIPFPRYLLECCPNSPPTTVPELQQSDLWNPPFATFHPATRTPPPGGKDFRPYQEEILLRMIPPLYTWPDTFTPLTTNMMTSPSTAPP